MFQSLEKKYNELIKMNEQTQIQIEEIKRDKNYSSLKTDTMIPKPNSNHKMKNKDDLFKKMHQASVEMEVNRESQIFTSESNNDKRSINTPIKMESHTGSKKLSTSSALIYSKIDKIYNNSIRDNNFDEFQSKTGS